MSSSQTDINYLLLSGAVPVVCRDQSCAHPRIAGRHVDLHDQVGSQQANALPEQPKRSIDTGKKRLSALC